MDKMSFTPVQEIGFSSMLEKLERFRGQDNDQDRQLSEPRAHLIKGDQLSGTFIVTTSSLFLEGIHFDPVYTPLGHLGYKMVNVVASRIAAKNAKPKFLTIGIATPNRYSVEMLEEIADGADRAAKEIKSTMKINELTAAHQALTFSISLVGDTGDKNAIESSSAIPGDQICITGDLGGAIAGLRVLLREKRAWQDKGEPGGFKPELEGYEYVIGKQLLPAVRLDLLHGLDLSGVVPASMIEISQGLINDLQIMMGTKGLGCDLFTPAIPIAIETRKVADEMKEDVDRYAYYGGEDYEMLFTLNQEDVERLRGEFDDFSVIGEVKEKDHGFLLHTGEGKALNIDEYN